MAKALDIIYQNGDFWVRKADKGLKGYEVYECGITHSQRRAIFGSDGPGWLQRAKDKADELAKRSEQ